jgi:hypothetical protein
MLIYLDPNVYFRPFNDQSQARIRHEAKAFVKILEQLECGESALLQSEILEFEIEQSNAKDLRNKDEIYRQMRAARRRKKAKIKSSRANSYTSFF